MPSSSRSPRSDLSSPTPTTIEALTVYHPLSGISTVTYTVFCASDVIRISEPEASEANRVDWFTPAEVRDLLVKGRVPDDPSLTALGLYLSICA